MRGIDGWDCWTGTWKKQRMANQWAALSLSPIPYPSVMMKRKKKESLRDWMVSSPIRKERERNESRVPGGATNVRTSVRFSSSRYKWTEQCRNIIFLFFTPPPENPQTIDRDFLFFLQNKIKTFFSEITFSYTFFFFYSSFKNLPPSQTCQAPVLSFQWSLRKYTVE